MGKFEYKKLVSIATWLFMIIIPSYLAIHLYKSDLFNILDIIEITLICILSNALLMFFLVQNNFDEAMATGVSVMFVSGAISLGVLVVSSLFRTYSRIKYKSILLRYGR